jgi:hypothetical protein
MKLLSLRSFLQLKFNPFLIVLWIAFSGASVLEFNSKVSASDASTRESLPYLTQNPQNYRKQNGKVSVVYYSSTKSLHRAMGRGFRDSRVFETIADSLTKKFHLRRDIRISLRQCGLANARYKRKSSEVELCYELVEQIENNFALAMRRRNTNASWGAFYTTLFILHHELAHALIDQFELPLSKSEEDVADELGTILAIDYTQGPSYGASISSITALQLFISAALTRNNPSRVGGKHSPDYQRGSNIQCLAYGASASLAQKASGRSMSRARQQQCRVKYNEARFYWADALKPYLR